MTVQVCAVVVKQLPARVSGKQASKFFNELVRSIKTGGASIVLDFSSVCQMDRTAIYLLLCCLEEAMKCDGDIKLSAISSEATAILEFAGVNLLFERFYANTEAVSSFHRPA